MPTTSGGPTPNSICYRSADNVRIRAATPFDIEAMRDLELHDTLAAHWTAAQYEALLTPETPERIAFVATDGFDESLLCGFLVARYLPDELEIENLVVDAGRRRQGIARSLIHELMAAACSGGIVSIILEVRDSNLPAVRLYESIGFTREGRRTGYYLAPLEDALLYRLTLRLCDKIP
jgi:[ribosomal protein S18]-alanine N-acetyltransferase